ncbi:MAG TPA: type II toxin-antitoxin system prevent-host-death family antitoxin [Gemmataceae bacterium]|nr:type II toxin-antitoxin system prevent-host-death family antitoxin [Gemmataceae bacterium]
MSSVTIQEAQTRLEELIDRVRLGDEVVITRDAQPVARLTAPVDPTPAPRRLGTLKGTVSHVAPDFDAPLDDFREYTG